MTALALARADAGPAEGVDGVDGRRIAGILLATVLVGLITSDWLAGFGVAVLLGGWWLLGRFPGPPVLPMAFTHQWAQVMIGLYYFHITGRRPLAMIDADCRPMMIVGLLSIGALAIGVSLGARRLLRREGGALRGAAAERFGLRELIGLYIASSVVASVFLELTRETAWLSGLFQGAVYLSYARLAVLFLLFRRLLAPKLHLTAFTALVLFEVALGITGYFAGFREVLVVAGLAVAEIFDRRRVMHWLTAAALVALLGLSGVIWQGIKGEYRAQFNEDATLAASRTLKLELVTLLAQQWIQRRSSDFLENVDVTVERLWQVYYPALALKRVPSAVPHTDGAFVMGAIIHVITPRFFFEDKGGLRSDSEKVRKYSGVNVAGAEEGTSIAFGYAAESYVDFGVPLMFAPIVAFGALMGWLFATLQRVVQREELATAATTTIFWLSLYLFERSWDRQLGMSLTLMIFLGGAVFVLDRALIELQPAYRAGLSPGSRAEPA